jgi:hypothetical protein
MHRWAVNEDLILQGLAWTHRGG